MYYSATHSRPHRTVKQNRAQNYNNFCERQNKIGEEFLIVCILFKSVSFYAFYNISLLVKNKNTLTYLLYISVNFANYL